MSMKFSMGMMMGLCTGVAVSALALDKMRPDVTAKMMRNGKRMVHRYKKMHSF